MVERQLRRRGISDERVLAAMAVVPRERFVPAGARSHAYDDAALGIEQGQTISQPWIVGAICQALALRGDELVLEVGTGSGYSAAVLSQLAREVTSVERHEPLARAAMAELAALGVDNVEIVVGDGSEALPGRAPFDAIAVHAATPGPPTALLGVLRPGGRLVAPVVAESGEGEFLTLFECGPEDGVSRTVLAPCRFVPLIGREGFPSGND